MQSVMQQFVDRKDRKHVIRAAQIQSADSRNGFFTVVGDVLPVRATARQISYYEGVDPSWRPVWSIDYSNGSKDYNRDSYNDMLINKDFEERFEPLSKKHTVRDRFEALLSNISFDGMLTGFEVFLSKPIEVDDVIYNLYLQIKCQGKCNVTGNPQKWSGRKWQLSEHMTDQEVVQTAFLATMTALEHEARELFKYKGFTIFDPHYDVEKLVALRQQPDSVVERTRLLTSNPKVGEYWIIKPCLAPPNDRYEKNVEYTAQVTGPTKEYPMFVTFDGNILNVKHVEFICKVEDPQAVNADTILDAVLPDCRFFYKNIKKRVYNYDFIIGYNTVNSTLTMHDGQIIKVLQSLADDCKAMSNALAAKTLCLGFVQDQPRKAFVFPNIFELDKRED